MPIPNTKALFMESIEAAALLLDETFALVPPDRARETSSDARSPAFWAAYQIGWGKAVLAWDAASKRGATPEMPAPGFRWNALGALAEFFDAERADMSFPALRADFRKTVEKVLALVDGWTEKELFTIGAIAWAGPKWPAVKWIQVNTVAPYRSARTKVRAWLRARSLLESTVKKAPTCAPDEKSRTATSPKARRPRKEPK